MSDPNALIKVALVDDHDLMRRGLALLLEVTDDMELVGEASNGREALALCNRITPDVILMDLMMPEMDGVAAIKAIHAKYPDIAIIVLTSFKDDDLVHAALQAGAIGYLLKNASSDEVTGAIRAVYGGKPALSSEVTEVLMKAFTSNEPQPTEPGYGLSERELEVLSLMAKGLTNREIAANLMLSYSTIRFHVSSILAKLGVTNRVEAVTLAMQHNLVK